MTVLATRGQRSLVAQRQAPLRALYATDPEEALTYKWARTSSADLAPLDDPFHTHVEVGREHPITLRLGIDRHVGGLGDLPNPATCCAPRWRPARTERSA